MKKIANISIFIMIAAGMWYLGPRISHIVRTYPWIAIILMIGIGTFVYWPKIKK